MKQKTRKVLGTAALIGSMLSPAYAEPEAQNAEPPKSVVPLPAPEPIPGVAPSLNFQLRGAYILPLSGSKEDYGFTSQNSMIYTNSDLKLNTLVETLPNGNVNFGSDLSTKLLRANIGYGFRDGEDLSRASLTLYPEQDPAKSFIGATFQGLPQGNRGIFFGGLDLTDKLHVEGTFDTEGNIRGALFPNLGTGNGVLGIGGGISSEGKWDINASYNTDKLWISLKAGQRPLDARFVFGNVDPNFTRYITTVTNQGDNELDVFPDQTLKFDIGKNAFFDHFGVPFFLAKDRGSFAVDVRYQEDRRLRANAAYRIGDIGPFKEAFVLGGAYQNLADEKFGVTFGTGFRVDDSPLKIGVKGDVNEDGKAVFGIFGQIDF